MALHVLHLLETAVYLVALNPAGQNPYPWQYRVWGSVGQALITPWPQQTPTLHLYNHDILFPKFALDIKDSMAEPLPPLIASSGTGPRNVTIGFLGHGKEGKSTRYSSRPDKPHAVDVLGQLEGAGTRGRGLATLAGLL